MVTQQLYFLRHATAEVIRPGQLDIDRCLIDKGRAQAMRVAEFMAQQAIRPAKVFSSPYPRAMQTAAIVCQQAQLAAVEEVPWLALETPVEAALEAISAAKLSWPSTVLLIGHEPDFSLLVSKLLGLDSARLKIRKSSLTCLELTVDGALLHWSVPVRFMR